MATIHINEAEARALAENPVALRELAKQHRRWARQLEAQGELLGRDMGLSRAKILSDAAFFIDGELDDYRD